MSHIGRRVWICRELHLAYTQDMPSLTPLPMTPTRGVTTCCVSPRPLPLRPNGPSEIQEDAWGQVGICDCKQRGVSPCLVGTNMCSIMDVDKLIGQALADQ